MKILISGASGLGERNLNLVFRFSICLLLSLQVVSCSVNQAVSLSAEQDFESIAFENEKNRRLWMEKNISDYAFVCERSAEGIGGDFKIKIEVRNNKTLPLKDKDKYPNLAYYEEINSMEKLFDYIQEMAEKGSQVKVAYNNELGFPEDISILIGKNTNGWVSIKIKQFEIVK